ncbi:unnamed protein product [Echinostoma caproni]|uniref:CID domain-containing protein n=1 Tax=Echinostoma caproni TaxID=27848 RepID=A0A183AYF6_9TREM|nr:unnamed protein product [Echinostoma caproni]
MGGLFVDESALQIDDPFPSIAVQTLDSINKLIRDTRRMHQLTLLEDDATVHAVDESTKDATANDADEEMQSRVYPDQLHIVEEVMLRCIHLLATNNPKSRILSMEVLIEGCLTLRDERGNSVPRTRFCSLYILFLFCSHSF